MMKFNKDGLTKGSHVWQGVMDARVKPGHDAAFLAQPRLRHAAREAFADLLLRQLAADEDDAADALFALFHGR